MSPRLFVTIFLAFQRNIFLEIKSWMSTQGFMAQRATFHHHLLPTNRTYKMLSFPKVSSVLPWKFAPATNTLKPIWINLWLFQLQKPWVLNKFICSTTSKKNLFKLKKFICSSSSRPSSHKSHQPLLPPPLTSLQWVRARGSPLWQPAAVGAAWPPQLGSRQKSKLFEEQKSGNIWKKGLESSIVRKCWDHLDFS